MFVIFDCFDGNILEMICLSYLTVLTVTFWRWWMKRVGNFAWIIRLDFKENSRDTRTLMSLEIRLVGHTGPIRHTGHIRLTWHITNTEHTFILFVIIDCFTVTLSLFDHKQDAEDNFSHTRTPGIFDKSDTLNTAQVGHTGHLDMKVIRHIGHIWYIRHTGQISCTKRFKMWST